MTIQRRGKRSRRAPVLAAGAALLLAAGTLAWTVFQPDGRERVAAPPAAAEAPAADDPSSVERILAARRAAFPNGPVVMDGAARLLFTDSRLVDAPFGPVLLTEGRVENAAHVDAGRIAAHYLRTEGSGFAVVRAFPAAAENGSHGSLGTWEVSDQFTEFPVLRTEGGGTWQGYTCTVATLTELTPDGPREIAMIPIGYDNGGAVEPGPGSRSIQGRIANVQRGRSFDVVFTGTENFTEAYAWRDGRFASTTGDSRATC